MKTGEEITESIQDGLRGKIKDHYLDGDLTEQEAQRLIERYTGRDAEEAEDDVNRWHYQRDTGDTDASASMAAAWYGIAEPAGIDREAFAEAWAFHNDVEADKDSSGKTVPGSKKRWSWITFRALASAGTRRRRSGTRSRGTGRTRTRRGNNRRRKNGGPGVELRAAFPVC